MAHAARRVDPQEYYEHITPGVRGTDPLGALGGGTLSTLASLLLGASRAGTAPIPTSCGSGCGGCTRPIHGG